jgi:peptidoglycan/LPS O-acetylase OafA/YrhL
MRIAAALLVFYQLNLVVWRYFGGYPLNPTPYIDGPVWTIVWEVVLYIILLFMGIAGLLNRFVVGSVYISATVVAFVIFDPVAVTQTVVGQMFMLFLGGCLIRLTEDDVDMRLCGLIAIAVLTAFHVTPIAEQVANLKAYIPFVFGPVFPFEHLRWMTSVMCLPYALIWVARYSPLSFPVKSDYSYGVYVSAWPIQQVATHLAAVNSVALPALWIFAISLTGSLLCALASWHLLEKHAIRLSHYTLRHGHGD